MSARFPHRLYRFSDNRDERNESEIRKQKADKRVTVNLFLLGVSFSLFTFIASTSPKLLRDNVWIAGEITIAIPLFLGSVFSGTKMVFSRKPELWELFGFILYVFGYSLLISAIGNLLSVLVSYKLGLAFFLANFVVALGYSLMDIFLERAIVWHRLIKDLLFGIIILLSGVFPSLGLW